MPHQPDKSTQHEFDTKDFDLHQASSQGWHFGIGDNFLSPIVLPRSGVTSSNQINFCQLNGQTSEVPVSRKEHGNAASSVLPPNMGKYLVQETQQDQMYSELHGVSHYGTASPFVLPEEPVYVNAKQYHAILRRRQLRAKAEMENKMRRVRKPYLHESRHLHALRRARGCGGRFVNTKKAETSSGNTTNEESNSMGDSPPSKNFCPEPDSRYSPAVSSAKVEPSTGFNDFKRLSPQGGNCPEFFQWRGFFSK